MTLGLGWAYPSLPRSAGSRGAGLGGSETCDEGPTGVGEPVKRPLELLADRRAVWDGSGGVMDLRIA